MPIHDVKCDACNSIEEVITLSIDDKFDPCPDCGAERQQTYDTWGMRPRTGSNFSPIIFGNREYNTRDEWNAYCKKFERIHGHELAVEGDTTERRIRSLEMDGDIALEAAERTRYRGEQQYEQHRREAHQFTERAISTYRRRLANG